MDTSQRARWSETGWIGLNHGSFDITPADDDREFFNITIDFAGESLTQRVPRIGVLDLVAACAAALYPPKD